MSEANAPLAPEPTPMEQPATRVVEFVRRTLLGPGRDPAEPGDVLELPLLEANDCIMYRKARRTDKEPTRTDRLDPGERQRRASASYARRRERLRILESEPAPEVALARDPGADGQLGSTPAEREKAERGRKPRPEGDAGAGN